MFATTLNDHLFWITSRAAGTLALLFSSVAVGVGVSMGGKLIKGRGPDLRATHEALSMATIVAPWCTWSLLGDRFCILAWPTSRSPSPAPARRSG